MTGANYTEKLITLRPVSLETQQITKELEMNTTPTKCKKEERYELESPVLDSTGRNDIYSKLFISSTPAGNDAKQTASGSKGSVLNILDQLCSPISKEKSEEWYIESLFQDSEKVMLRRSNKNKTSLVINSVLNDHKNFKNSNSLHKSSEESITDNLNATHNHFFDDISDTSLQLLCEATNNIVDNSKLISNSKKNTNDNGFAMSNKESKDDKCSDGYGGTKVLSINMSSNFNDGQTEPINQFIFHDRKLIYSNQNLRSCDQSVVQLNDLFSEVKCLEEANRYFKKDLKHRDFQVINNQASPILNKAKPKEHCQPLEDIVSIKTQSELEEKSKVLNDSLGITDTQFCEAVEAAELMSNLDATCNVHNQSTSSTTQSALKLCSTSLKTNGKLLSDTELGIKSIKENFQSSKSSCFDEPQKLLNKPDCEQNLLNINKLPSTRDGNTEITDVFQIQSIKSINKYDKTKIINTNVEDSKFIHYSKQNKELGESTKIDCSTSYEFEPILEGFQSANRYPKISKDSLDCDTSNVIHKGFLLTSENIFKKSDVSTESDNIDFEPPLRQNPFNTSQKTKLIGTRETTKHVPVAISKVNDKGFLTDIGKSLESLDKARKELDNETCISHKGFQTAGGKLVEVSEKSLMQVKQLFSEELTLVQRDQQIIDQKLGKVAVDSLFNKQAEQLPVLDSKPRLLYKGFSMASGKSVKVSDESLEKAKKLLDDLPSCIDEIFPTINEKSFRFSEKSSKNTKESFDSQLGIIKSEKFVLMPPESLEKNRTLLDSEKRSSYKGFQTASGKTVEIPEESLKQAKQLLNDEPNFIERDQPITYQKLKGETKKSLEQAKPLLKALPSLKCKGFSTASGKSVKVSEKSLEKAKKMLDDVPSPINEIYPTVNEKSIEFLVTSSEYTKGFLTASGKSVQISDKSLEIAKRFLDDERDNKKSIQVSENSFTQPKELCDQLSNTAQTGFKTASGNLVKISEDSLAKAKQFFDEESHSIQNNDQILNHKSDIPKKSLDQDGKVLDGELNSIPNQKLVNISDKSLKKVKDLIGNEPKKIQKGFQPLSKKCNKVSEKLMEQAKESLGSQLSINHKGFLTASGKSVQISDESLERARKFLVDEQNIIPQGFQTASGKLVHISEDALLKAKQLLEDQQNLIHKDPPSVCDTPSELALNQAKLINDGNVIIRNEEIQPVKEESYNQEVSRTTTYKSTKIPEKLYKNTENMMKNIAHEPDILLDDFGLDGKLVEVTRGCSKTTKNYFPVNCETILFPKGFQTASGRSVKISEESLKKAKSLLDNTDLELTTSQLPTDSKLHFKNRNESSERVPSNEKNLPSESYETEYILKGFRKSDSKSNISEKPSTKVVTAQDLLNCKTKLAFQTASGKNVHISDESLRKTKDFFNDDFNTTDHNLIEFDKSRNKSLVHDNTKTNINALNNYSSTNQLDTSLGLDKTKSNEAFHVIEDNKSENNDSSNLKKYYLHSKTDTYNKDQKRKRDISVQEESTCDNLKLNEPSLKNLDQNNSHCIRKRRKLFGETDQRSDDRLICNEENSFMPIGASVISEADLSLLNQSKINNSGNENLIQENCTPYKMSPSTAREISESMAALLADEASNSPFSLKPYVSSPSMINDRHGLPSIDCFENEIHFNERPLSPILGSQNLFKKKSIGNISTPGTLSSNTDQTQPSGFKPPYATSTPNESQLHSKRKLLYSNLYSNSEKRQKRAISPKSATPIDVVKLRLEAALKQEQQVNEKLKAQKKEKPRKGSYLLRKETEKSLSLRALRSGPLRLYSTHQLNQYGVKKTVQDLTIQNVSDFKFAASDYYSKEIVLTNINGIPVGDGALLILDGEGNAGVKEVTRAFMASPSIDPSLISTEWVENHYKWIVLKMGAMEKMFPRELGSRYLTPNNLMLQLKYRYDREIDRNQRPALRKILERDENAAKTMVLFVADIFHAEIHGDDKKQMGRQEIELSDSWYSVKASIDHEMEALIRSKKVKVGTKLMITGAELINNDAGCHPLEAPANVRLRVSTNSCRRARWYGRLGFHARSPSPLRLNTVLARGGALPALTALVARTYPILFLEKINGRTVIRNERTEQAMADEHQTKRQQCAEAIYTELQQSLDTSRSTKKHSNIRSAIKTATNTKQLYSLLDGVDDISCLQDILTKEQLSEVQQLKEEETKKTQQKLQERLVEELNKKVPPRNVTRMLKTRLVDDYGSCSALLTVWNPSDDVISCVSEGNVLTFFNISASGFSRFGDLQLTAGKQTRYSLQKHCSSARRITALTELQNSQFKPQFSEVDVVGIVVQSMESAPDKTSSLVYLADSDHNLLGISFWTDLKMTGYANTLTPGALVAVSNLHWRSNVVSWKLPSAYVTEMTTFSQHPRQPHLSEALTQLRSQLQAEDLAKYLENCQERIQSLVAQRNSGGLQPDSTPTVSVAGHSASGSDKLLRDSTNFSVNENTDTPTNRRLEMLERYGEPPPITLLPTSTPTSVKRSFRPPLRKFTNKR